MFADDVHHKTQLCFKVQGSCSAGLPDVMKHRKWQDAQLAHCEKKGEEKKEKSHISF